MVFSQLHLSSENVFNNMNIVRNTLLYCRNAVRRLIRFPIPFATFIIFCILLLILHSDPTTTTTTTTATESTSDDSPPPEPCPLANSKVEDTLRDGLQRCPHLIRPRPSKIRTLSDHWQYHRSGSAEIIVYSAFFDDRPLVGVSTWIRVVGMAANITSGNLFCQMWYGKRSSSPYLSQALVTLTGRKAGYVFENKRFLQYLFSCDLPTVTPVPSHVSLVVEPCESSTILLPVQHPLRAPHEHEFGVCVPVSFGTVPIPAFVEWIEMLHLLGVTEFNIYDANMTGMTDAFNRYIDRGWLKVLPAPSALNLTDIDGPKFGSAAVLNDCMMRNLYRYRLLLVIDLDEVVVPRQHRNYSTMVEHINKVLKLSDLSIGYAFRNAFFFRDLKPDPAQPPYLRTMAFRTRSDVPKYRTAPKSFIDPLQCLSVFNHFCLIPLKAKTKPLYHEVPPTVAVTHHYRMCGFTVEKCREYFNSTVKDNTTLIFKDELESRVKVSLAELGALPSSALR